MPKFVICTLLSLLLLLVACSENSDFPSERRVEKIYGLYLDGRYEKYVEHIQSCKNKPADYKARIVNLHRSHAEAMKAKGKEVTDFKVSKMERRQGAEVVNVYLKMSYADGMKEEVLFPMVYDEEEWWAW